MVDEEDSKSFGRDTVWVRVPPPAPEPQAHVGELEVFLCSAAAICDHIPRLIA